MKNIFLLPTQNNKSKLATYHYKGSKNIKFGELGLLINNTVGWTNLWSEKEMYITSEEEIKDCWVLNTHLNELYFCKGFYGIQPMIKKVNLTTDSKLIEHGIQPIDSEFLQWFVNNSSCEFINVFNDKEWNKGNCNISNYKIIIPQQEWISPIKVKEQLIKMMQDDEELGLYEEDSIDKELEEAAQKEYPHALYENDWNALQNRKREEFIKGAKWKAERSYSEEDMIQFAQIYLSKRYDNPRMSNKDIFNLWFEQFKKK